MAVAAKTGSMLAFLLGLNFLWAGSTRTVTYEDVTAQTGIHFIKFNYTTTY